MDKEVEQLMASDPDFKKLHDIAKELFGEFKRVEILKEKTVDMTQFAGNESKSEWLKASDIKGKNVKVTIESVGTVTFPATDDQPERTKATLKFKDREKGLVINATNTRILLHAFTNDSEKWIGQEIGLTTRYYEAFGVDGIVVEIINKDFDDDVPF